MTQLIVQDLEDTIRNKLEVMAKQHGRSIEEEVREILREAVMQHDTSDINLGSRIAKRFTGQGLYQDIPELRDQPLSPPDFNR